MIALIIIGLLIIIFSFTILTVAAGTTSRTETAMSRNVEPLCRNSVG